MLRWIVLAVLLFCAVSESTNPSWAEFQEAKRRVEDIAQLNIEEHKEAYRKAKQRLFLLDSDGTLRNSNTDMHRLSSLLEQLVNDSRNRVWILSARPVANLLKVYGHISGPLRLGGEHGLVTFDRVTGKTVFTGKAFALDDLKTICQEALSANSKEVEKWKVTKNLASLMISYEKTDDVKADAMAEMIRRTLKATYYSQFNVDHVPAQGVINILPPNSNKGSFAQIELRKLQPNAFVVSMGDEEPDEAMHAVVNQESSNQLSVVVSSKADQRSCAMYKLNGVPAVHNFLQGLSEIP